MLRGLFTVAVLGGLLFAPVGLADDKQKGDKKKDEAKEVVLKGMVTCGKCDLKVDKKCATVVKVKDGDKDVVYYFDEAGHKKYHEGICTAGKEGTVTGKVTEKDGKKWVAVSKVEFK